MLLTTIATATLIRSIGALVPGELAKIVRQAVAPHLEDITKQLADAKNGAREIVKEEWSELTEPYRQKLAALQKGVKSITKKYEKEAKRLNQRMKRDLAPFAKPLAELQAEITECAATFDPDLPERPTQSEGEQDEGDCLFDSSRPYLGQLRFYKAQR